MSTHAPAPVAAADATTGPKAPTRTFLLRWVAIVGTGEFVGFLVPVTAGVLWADAPWGAIVIVAAGAIEGAILGLAQWAVMRRDLSRLRPGRWIGLTALAASAAYLLGLLPAATESWWTTWPLIAQILLAIPLFSALLLSIGAAQWLVLRRNVAHAWWWILGTATAWLAGLGVFFAIAPPLWHEGQSTAVAVVIGGIAGAAMATVMALVTGATWLRLRRGVSSETAATPRASRPASRRSGRRARRGTGAVRG